MSSVSAMTDALVTGEQLLRLKDLGPCELVEGRIVRMSPTGPKHGRIELKLAHRLETFVSGRSLGWVMTGEVGIFTRRNPDSVRAADVVFISRGRLPQLPESAFLEVAPELVVEIVSPSDSQKELQEKIREYLAIGVNWVWVVEPETRRVWVYRPEAEPQELSENDTLVGEGVLAGFEVAVAELFEG